MFPYDYDVCKSNWSSEMKAILSDLNMPNSFVKVEQCIMEQLENVITDLKEKCWGA